MLPLKRYLTVEEQEELKRDKKIMEKIQDFTKMDIYNSEEEYTQAVNNNYRGDNSYRHEFTTGRIVVFGL